MHASSALWGLFPEVHDGAVFSPKRQCHSLYFYGDAGWTKMDVFRRKWDLLALRMEGTTCEQTVAEAC
jgi:hypothetical protein